MSVFVDDAISAVICFIAVGGVGFIIRQIYKRCGSFFKRIEDNGNAVIKKQDEMSEKLDDLIVTDKHIIKDRITQGHDYFMEKGDIDKYSLESFEDLFSDYTSYHGNSFVHSHMDDLRELYKSCNKNKE